MSYGNIFIEQITGQGLVYTTWKKGTCNKIPFKKYTIKETDFRVKTATFTTPQKIDLTLGQFAVLMVSSYHENFAGEILDVDYDEESKMYTYQCQDWSRQYISKFEWFGNYMKLYNFLRVLITRGGVGMKPSAKDLKKFYTVLSGLKSISWYSQDLYKGNIFKGNPMQQTVSLIARDKSWIEVIRALVYNSLGFFDVWFNDRGAIQIEPISKTDWENTGLVLKHDFYNRKIKFATTNVITGVRVNGEGLELGTGYGASQFTKLRLDAFFGEQIVSMSNPNKNTNKSNAVKSNTSNKNNTNQNGNPYNNKAKKVWINSDNGSNSMKNALIDALKNDGWTVHDGGTWSNAHIQDVFNLDSSYSVYITLYNGFCAGTIREAYSSYVQNPLKEKGVQLVPIWDSSDWTNPNGMKPYRYGDFSGYNAGRAWDDNFSSSDPSISNVGDFMKQNKATYCVSPTCSEIMQQFRAGGYFKYKGINV